MDSPCSCAHWIRRSMNAVVRLSVPALLLGGMQAGCQSSPEPLPTSTPVLETSTLDARLPDSATLTQLSQIDGSVLGFERASEEIDPETPEIGEPPETTPDEPVGETLILARGSGDPVPEEPLRLPVAELQAKLSDLAATADDPTPYELAAALIPLIAVPEFVEGGYPEYAPRIHDLSSDEELLVLGTADFAFTVRRRLDAGEPPMAVIASEIERLREGLRDDSGLQIERVALCSAIRGFGDFDELDRRLPTRSDRDALVYVALDGLDWQALENGTHRWTIDHRIELRQLSDGFVIDPGRWAIQTHTLSEPSRDAFFWVRIRLPIEDLSAGRYGLKIRVREPSTGREVEKSLDLEIVPARMLTDAADR